MGRKRKRKLPGVGSVMPTAQSSTLLNILGLLVFCVGCIAFISFFVFVIDEQEGRILFLINQIMVQFFGWTSIFIPFLLVFISGHFFKGDKFHIVKPNVTVGFAFMFLALTGFTGAGQVGDQMNAVLVYDFSRVGAGIIYAISFLIGLILFFDASISHFLHDTIQKIKSIFSATTSAATAGADSLKEKESVEKDAKDTGEEPKKRFDFISDEQAAPTKKPPAAAPAIAAPEPVPAVVTAQDISIKPVTGANSSTWVYPPHTIMRDIEQGDADRGDVNKNADIIEQTLESFGIRARVRELNKGPTVTQYALEITMGTKLSKITSLGNDLALALAAPTGAVRIEAPIPGRSLVGVEIPNIRSQMVTLKQLIDSEVFQNNPDPLLVPLGLDVSGRPAVYSIAKMPHVLIAGTTGSGKSVMLNAWLATFLFRTRPDELRMIMVDPKRVELAMYNGIPHLLTEPIVEPQKIISALQWTVAEMENRNKEFAQAGVRNLDGYNKLEHVEKKPYIVFVIDELADLMMVASKEAEDYITRIAQMARATGIHLILATQRPSVDVITGLMKANIPTRLAFNVSSMVDSRVIIDGPGAEKLLGKGDMLFLPPDMAKPSRMQGAFVDDAEVSGVVNFLKSQVPEVQYTDEITTSSTGISMSGGRPAAAGGGASSGSGEPADDLLNQAIELISQFDKASASLLQRRLKVGYARAARILDQLEEAGYVGPSEGSKPREVLQRQAPAAGGELSEGATE